MRAVWFECDMTGRQDDTTIYLVARALSVQGSAHKAKLRTHRKLYCRLTQDRTLRREDY